MDMQRFSLTARFLHWTIAPLVLVQLALGFAADLSDKPLADRLLDQHVRIGLLIFGLMLLRLTWRIAVRPPALPESITGWRRRTAECTHLLLYGLLLMMPVTGYVLWAWTGPKLDWWGLGRIPMLFRGGDDELWRSVAGYAHEYGGYVVTALILLHIGAALHHQFVGRDGLISRRMGFGAIDQRCGAG